MAERYNMLLEENRTIQILRKAEEGKYGILAQSCYDAQSAIALVRAAERKRSPAIINLFPITLAYGRGPFLQFCINAAHMASVPISVCLDHATDPEHLELVLGLAEKQGIVIDTVMVDSSHADTDEENITLSRPYVQRCTNCGISVEVELGRLEGGEAGLRVISDAKLTNPEKAEHFMAETGAIILAPSIGNIHGRYVAPPNFRQDILKDLHSRFKGKVPLCLHGTDDLPDALFQECIANGITKINVNSWAREPYLEVIKTGLNAGKPFPEVIEESTEAFAKVCERFMDVFGSSGKA